MKLLNSANPTRKQKYWLEIVAEYRQSGLTQAQFAIQRRLSTHTLRYWCARFGDVTDGENPQGAAFTKVHVESPRQLLRASVRLPNGTVVELSDQLAIAFIDKIAGVKST